VTTHFLRFIRLFRILIEGEKPAAALRSGAVGRDSLEPGKRRAPLSWSLEMQGDDHDKM
jgi:hypothetical protein